MFLHRDFKSAQTVNNTPRALSLATFFFFHFFCWKRVYRSEGEDLLNFNVWKHSHALQLRLSNNSMKLLSSLSAESHCLLATLPWNQVLVLVWELQGGSRSPYARGWQFKLQKDGKQLSRREELRLQVELFWGRNIKTVNKSKLLGTAVQTMYCDEKGICTHICFAETTFSP